MTLEKGFKLSLERGRISGMAISDVLLGIQKIEGWFGTIPGCSLEGMPSINQPNNIKRDLAILSKARPFWDADNKSHQTPLNDDGEFKGLVQKNV